MSKTESHVDRFFAYARERHAIYLRREFGATRPWTEDAILNEYRFTNVFRELDKTTAWFRKYVRDPLRDKPEVLLATVVFRLLNRIETGEAIFSQTVLEGDLQPGARLFGTTLPTAFDLFVFKSPDARHLKGAILDHVGRKGPYVTGAYIISSPSGHSKLDGMLKVIGDFHRKSGWLNYALGARQIGGRESLFNTWSWLREQPFLGGFHSYEIVTDLRHTALLDKAPDIDTWANMGPGAKRGLNRIHDRCVRGDQSKHKWSASIEPEQALEEMRILLDASRSPEFWPQPTRGKTLLDGVGVVIDSINEFSKRENWPKWELRDVEHTLCEFDKYERVRRGEGKPRGVYR